MSADKKNYVLSQLSAKRQDYEKRSQASRAYAFKRAFDSLSSLPQETFDLVILDSDALEALEGMTVKAAEFIKEILKNYKFYQAAQAQCNPDLAQGARTTPVVVLDTTNLDVILLEIQQNKKLKYAIPVEVDFRRLLLLLHTHGIKSVLNLESNNFLVECLL